MTETYSYTAEREIRTHAYLYSAARDALDKAKTIEEGSFYQTMSSLVFSAFALEAYLNHVGESTIKYWDEIESIKTFSKLKVLYDQLDLYFDAASRPIQTVKQVFKFRNFMAHGRTEKVSGSGTLNKPKRDPGENLVEITWEKFCSTKEAEKVMVDVKEIMKTMAAAAGLEDWRIFSLGNGSWKIGSAKP